MANEFIKTSLVSPAFLHGNSTSHTWPFSAVAEIIDNAYDPDVNASEIRIDKRVIGTTECLAFSGSMRLGTDALVFTRCMGSTSVGFLSQTYLKAIGADSVLVPIVTWNISGTNQDRFGNLELDFSSDKNDIRNPETPLRDLTTINRPVYNDSPEYRRSLRQYCSILYLKPRMKIMLRGNKDKPIKLIFGFTNNKEPDSYGLMLYHKNRLIRAYERVGCQKQANTHGVGVLGVVENAGGKLNDYFFEKTNSQNPSASQPASSQLPDWTWAQCDNCLRWRRLPAGISADSLPDKWFCKDNPDATFNRCDIQEEPEDENQALMPTYTKTYKKTILQEKTILQFEKQKLAIKEKSTALIRIARSLEITNSQSRTLVEKAQNLAGQSSLAVSSSSTSNPAKRKSDDEDGSNERCTKIKTEDGGFITVPNAGGDAGLIDLKMEEEDLEETGATTKTPWKTKLSAPHPKTCNESANKKMGSAGNADSEDSSNKSDESDKTSKKTSGTKTDKNVDKENKKYSDKETEGTAVEAEGNGYLEINDDDVKPDKEKLDKTVYKDEKTDSKAKKEVDMKERNVEVTLKNNGVKKEFKSAHVQTVPVISNLASPEEVDSLSLCAVVQKQMLLVKERELSETKKSLTSLQSNIWKLLKIIASDLDYGDPENIEQIIVEFIRVSSEKDASEETDKKNRH
ncbi:MORC3-like protein [Mya arenaria]|uniref:MORC3-like protein n=1 Tax=Mya arenaria TaxID=6604 RepID=A0ABY7EKF7_MYAAR|nr:MORC3-like protein [Mya arenaria]